MEKKEKVINTISFVSSSSLDSFFSYDSAYRKLRSEYPDYSLMDLLMVSKIDRMQEKRQITEKTHDQLIELYDLRVQTDREYWGSFGEENEDVLLDKLTRIDEVLSGYGLVCEDFRDFLDSAIEPKLYGEVEEGPVLKLLRENDSK